MYRVLYIYTHADTLTLFKANSLERCPPFLFDYLILIISPLNLLKKNLTGLITLADKPPYVFVFLHKIS